MLLEEGELGIFFLFGSWLWHGGEGYEGRGLEFGGFDGFDGMKEKRGKDTGNDTAA